MKCTILHLLHIEVQKICSFISRSIRSGQTGFRKIWMACGKRNNLGIYKMDILFGILFANT